MGIIPMAIGGLFNGLFGQKIPTPPLPPPAANPPILANPATALAGAGQQSAARRAAGAGFGDTIQNLNGPPGLVSQSQPRAVKSLLG